MSVPSASPVDLAHLSRYTGGSRELNSDVLQLFLNQSTELMLQLQAVVEAADTRTWRHITHSLKGAARGIGAFGLADVAAEAEPLDPAAQHGQALKVLLTLRNRAETVQDFIRAYLDE
ncbi:MAG: Hpt domain-containing protein [Alphaproteobacteria bacterium]|nr:Hpt domain-containing protein [Alphaproteobacteria bacterium]MBV9063127.1 Hpt domain-containing protein [Alphaproteobacteria bacterium]